MHVPTARYKVYHPRKAPIATIVDALLDQTISLQLYILRRFTFFPDCSCSTSIRDPATIFSLPLIGLEALSPLLIMQRRLLVLQVPRPLSSDGQTMAQRRVEALRGHTVKLMGGGRIRAASNNLNTIAQLLEGKVYPEPLTGAALQQRIDILHPDSNDMDLLPPVEDDPPAEPLQINPHQLR